MANRPIVHNVDELIESINSQLSEFGICRNKLTLREKVCELCKINRNIKDLGVSITHEHGLTETAARKRIAAYLIEYVGHVIEGEELAVVSGISDYPRRIRELRVEQGFQIASGSSPDPDSGIVLKPDQYLLVCETPDDKAAKRWHVVNRIRRSDKGSREKILEFLLENVGQTVTTEELAYVANQKKEFARRIRELRTEHGYQIATSFTGRPDLAIGQYVLESAERRTEQHDRHIPREVEKEVYNRDSNTCRVCGWNRNRWRSDDPRILELHHIKEHQQGGENISQNLIVLCSKCHDEVHTGKHREIIEKIKSEFSQ